MSEALRCDCQAGGDGGHDTSCLVGAIHGVANSLTVLGLNGAGTSMGAIEALALEVTKAAGTFAASLVELGDRRSGCSCG